MCKDFRYEEWVLEWVVGLFELCGVLFQFWLVFGCGVVVVVVVVVVGTPWFLGQSWNQPRHGSHHLAFWLGFG